MIHYSSFIFHNRYLRKVVQGRVTCSIQGFTLVEMLIVITIFGVAIVGGSGMFLSLVGNNRKTESMIAVKRAGDGIISDFTQEVKWAKAVELPASCHDVNNPASPPDAALSSVVVKNVDDEYVGYGCVEQEDSASPDQILKGVSTGVGADLTAVDEFSELTIELIDEQHEYQLSNCEFRCFTNSGRQNVTFSFDLTTLDQEVKSFSSSLVLRNSQP